MSVQVAIIDYGMGNLKSLSHALEFLGCQVRWVSKGSLLSYDIVFLPGVGAFGDAMAELNRMNMIRSIDRYIQSGRLFVGICLGMQLLFEKSEETKGIQGLGVLPGCVVRLPQEESIKNPHMGWNQCSFLSNSETSVFSPFHSQSHFMYFVHSYAVLFETQPFVQATTDHGQCFCSIVLHDNVVGFQGHPEKSQKIGLQTLSLLKNWGNRLRRDIV